MARVLVAARGPLVHRLVQTVRDAGLEVVVVFTAAEADASWVEEADYAAFLPDLAPGRLVDAALDGGCDALHPGCGVRSLDPALARAATLAGLKWLGPPLDALEARVGPVDVPGRHVVVVLAGDDRAAPQVVGLAGLVGPDAWESPDPALPSALQQDLARQAVARLGRVSGVAGVGFGVLPDGRVRVRAEHRGLPSGWLAVEAATGVDLLALGLRLADGATLDGPLAARQADHGISLALRGLGPGRWTPPRPWPVGVAVLGGGEGLLLPDDDGTVLHLAVQAPTAAEARARLREAFEVVSGAPVDLEPLVDLLGVARA